MITSKLRNIMRVERRRVIIAVSRGLLHIGQVSPLLSVIMGLLLVIMREKRKGKKKSITPVLSDDFSNTYSYTCGYCGNRAAGWVW